jgi:hypothetical protein
VNQKVLEASKVVCGQVVLTQPDIPIFRDQSKSMNTCVLTSGLFSEITSGLVQKYSDTTLKKTDRHCGERWDGSFLLRAFWTHPYILKTSRTRVNPPFSNQQDFLLSENQKPK